MTPRSRHPQLSPHEEDVLLDWIEGSAAPEAGRAADALFRQRPDIHAYARLLWSDRQRVVEELSLDLSESPDLVESVLVELQPAPAELRRMDLPRHRRRLQWSSVAARRVAAAAAVLIIAGFTAAYIRSQSPSRPAPTPIASNNQDLPPSERLALEPLVPDDAAPDSTPPALADRALALATDQWRQDRPAEPDLNRAAQLLAEGRLVIRVLATSDETAREGLVVMQQGVDARSTAWALADRLNRAHAARWESPDRPVTFAMDEQTNARVAVPQPALIDAWCVRIEPDPQAVASMMHTLSQFHWNVHLEEAPEPIAIEPSSLDALWWTQPPSTWKPLATAPIVIEALRP